jgi:hypothetical protein
MANSAHAQFCNHFRWVLLFLMISGFCLPARAQGPRRGTPPATVRKELIATLLSEDDLGECLKDFGQETLDGFESSTSIEEVDFNGDGHVEYLVSMHDKCSCGAHNCTIAIYQRTVDGFLRLLEGTGISFEILKAAHSGFYDAVITAHNSAGTVYREFYSYNGKQYTNSHSTFVNLETGESKPSERKIQFKRGSSAETVAGKVTLGFPDTWVLRARAGQTLTLALTGPQNDLSYFVTTPKYGSLVTRSGGKWRGVLPEDGEYRIVVQADKARAYKLTVDIN